jgi:AraC-like DNA-binding protein
MEKEKEQAEEERLFLLGMVRDYQQKERVRLDFSDDGLTAADRAFLSDLTAIMQENITSPELDIDSITARLKISRAKFFYKVKKLTGETPGSFFRIFKLNRAATLLKEDKYNISEITDRTGFSSVSHFSTSFKKRYGVSPKEYKGNQ